MTATTSDSGVGDLPEYDDFALPLRRQLSVRISAPMYARLVTRALTSRSSEGAIVRRWLWRGALAEGIDLNKPL